MKLNIDSDAQLNQKFCYTDEFDGSGHAVGYVSRKVCSLLYQPGPMHGVICAKNFIPQIERTNIPRSPYTFDQRYVPRNLFVSFQLMFDKIQFYSSKKFSLIPLISTFRAKLGSILNFIYLATWNLILDSLPHVFI